MNTIDLAEEIIAKRDNVRMLDLAEMGMRLAVLVAADGWKNVMPLAADQAGKGGAYPPIADRKDNLMYYTIDMLTKRLDDRNAQFDRVNNENRLLIERVTARDEQLVKATERELALMAHVGRLRAGVTAIANVSDDVNHVCDLAQELYESTPTQSLAAIEKRVLNASADLLQGLNDGALSQYHCARILQQKAKEIT